MQNASQKRSVSEINLDCGRPVSFSFYDDLIGISSRYSHPIVPDPEVSLHLLRIVHYNSKTFKIIGFGWISGSDCVSEGKGPQKFKKFGFGFTGEKAKKSETWQAMECKTVQSNRQFLANQRGCRESYRLLSKCPNYGSNKCGRSSWFGPRFIYVTIFRRCGIFSATFAGNPIEQPTHVAIIFHTGRDLSSLRPIPAVNSLFSASPWIESRTWTHSTRHSRYGTQGTVPNSIFHHSHHLFIGKFAQWFYIFSWVLSFIYVFTSGNQCAWGHHNDKWFFVLSRASRTKTTTSHGNEISKRLRPPIEIS